ncbi:16S rRNA (uracil(1498)-N(3))-methyltransferase [Antarcticibacterium flavum]|uniref:Ribosomal RNA small subunit methyltransferase E n=1 Tax=Antarcticibacterium flavum TaxID=2058175 RepID=A0A5B7X0I7_9FLAO|nr:MULTISPECIES: 16S rRNA (uracil(1498)-N(3))-methyltransferase [Antarcticibacterium]MCM4158839.1 16S rRNA (uracil(1498)-N(3))-methyltransferase [Antarcticibacterium sp. W02-3]QCY68103.1 16S rRNA (uracil(1498)-N(3))-methyltransferase [Antarcticibacterium flavum]
MQLFYHPEIDENDRQVIFPKVESRHIVKVLRKKEGDILNVTNGKGFLFKTEILSIDSRQCTATVLETEKEAKPAYYLHLAVAPTKMNDRYEWFLEKATEIGVREITPVICEHSERKVVKLERYERVLQSAMKQSLHLSIPKLNKDQAFSDFISSEIEGDKFIAHCEEGDLKKSLKSVLNPGTRSTILIGPEGDFSSNEIAQALENNWIPVSLGNSRLRTETAAIVACHTVALANEE